jgi:hypothetical protein
MKKNFFPNLHFACVVFSFLFLIAHSAIAQPTSQTFNSSGTYTVPAGWTAIATVEVWGAGGSGGGGNAANPERAGGGGGGYARIVLTLAAGNYAVTVGTGGIAPTNGAAGKDGAKSDFAGLVSAKGGKGANGNTAGSGGSGDAGTGVTIFSGGNGGTGVGPGGGGGGSAFATANGTNGANSTNTLPGSGGSGQGDGGTGGTDHGGNGVNGVSPGGGGGGKGDQGANSGNGANGRVIITVDNQISLPVKLTDFSAQYKNQFVILNWTTASEINVSHFVIERSTDGANYADAGVVFANGNAVDKTNYSFSDYLLNVQSTIVYYRLRSVDIDGKSQYSETRIIRISKNADNNITIVAYPNPVTNELRVTIPSNWQNKKVTYELFNANGQTAKKIENSSSNQTETLQVNNLAPGFYIVRVNCNGETSQQKIIKQ